MHIFHKNTGRLKVRFFVSSTIFLCKTNNTYGCAIPLWTSPCVICFTTSHKSPSSCRRIKKQQQLKLALPMNMVDNNADIREKTEQKVAAFHNYSYSGNGVMTKQRDWAVRFSRRPFYFIFTILLQYQLLRYFRTMFITYELLKTIFPWKCHGRGPSAIIALLHYRLWGFYTYEYNYFLINLCIQNYVESFYFFTLYSI